MKKILFFKKEKGITLIALVVTIIVLLILAAVTIAVLFGDNGIITKAKQAADVYEEAQEEENEDLMWLEKIIDSKTYPSVAKMKEDRELKSGEVARTEAYWSYEYGGGAYYDIVETTDLTVDNGKCIQLDNGLYAQTSY